MARILITGNKGFFGARFQRHYSLQHQILGIDRDEVDIVDRDAVLRTIEEYRPEIVIHGAAITATSFSDKHPELTRQINVDGAVHVAEGAMAVGARLLFFSTEQVFNGNVEAGPYREEHAANPDTMYGRTKLEAEDRLRGILSDLWILRFTWMFGLPEYQAMVNPNVVWDALRIAVSGKPARIPVQEFRGLTWVYHMIDRILGVLEIPPGTYHIGSENELGRYDIFRHIFRELGIASRIDDLLIPDHDKYRAKPRDVRLDTGKIGAAGITFPPGTEAISECIREFSMTGMGSP